MEGAAPPGDGAPVPDLDDLPPPLPAVAGAGPDLDDLPPMPLSGAMGVISLDELPPMPAGAPGGGSGGGEEEPDVQREPHDWDIVETEIIEVTERSLGGEGDSINEYRLVRQLGHGSFGEVWHAERVAPDGSTRGFALKRMSKRKLRKVRDFLTLPDGTAKHINGVDKVLNEVQLMRHCFHRNVVVLFEFMNDPAQDEVVLVQELMRGPVMDVVVERGEYVFPATGGAMDDAHAAKFFLELLDGLAYLHSKGIAHRDIKPDNILLYVYGDGSTSAARIGDFGSACSVGSPPLDRPVVDTAGTMAFWPPEAVGDPDGDDGPRAFSAKLADVWAAGVTLFCFLHGVPPFREETPGALLTAIANRDVEPLAGPGSPSEAAVDVMRCLLQRTPGDRASLADVRAMPWLEAARANLERDLAELRPAPAET